MISIELAPGVRLALGLPEGGREEAESALPAVDVSAVPGARVVLRRGFVVGETGGVVVRAACVTAPSDRWAPGLEELVLGRATGLATAGLGVTVERWEVGAIARVGERFEQRVTGRTGEREVAAVQHTLGFVGASHEVLVCSVACAEREGGGLAVGGARGGGGRCDEVVGAVVGPLVGPPPPSLMVRAVLFAAEQPYEAAAGAAVLCVAVIAVVLARRPKVPGRRLFP